MEKAERGENKKRREEGEELSNCLHNVKLAQ